MPSVDSLEALYRAVAGFEATKLALEIEPSALAAARRGQTNGGKANYQVDIGRKRRVCLPAPGLRPRVQSQVPWATSRP